MVADMRQNPATKDWVFIIDHPVDKPSDYPEKPTIGLCESAEYDAACPFCPGAEHDNDEFLSIKHGGIWAVRIVENKYPYFQPSACKTVSPQNDQKSIFVSIEGCGHHKVVIESPVHNQTIATMSSGNIFDILSAYHQCYIQIEKDPESELIIIFRNNGEAAGASLRHPHSQIICTKVIPHYIKNQIGEAENYFLQEGHCIYCVMLAAEIERKTRVIYENEHFVVFVPFASGSAYETMLVPKIHNASFGNISPPELLSCADALKYITSKMHKNLDNPAYNYLFRTAPVQLATVPYYHWFINIIPRKHPMNGFEAGTGIKISAISPEKAADTLRN